MPEALSPFYYIPSCGEIRRGPPERKKLNEYYPEGGKLISGWFDVRLITKSELIIPDGFRYKAAPGNHSSFRFFRHPDGVCAIPGIELRMALRSMYEAASNSCFPLSSEQRTQVYGAFKHRGLLEYDKTNKYCRLWKAKVYHIHITSSASIKSGRYYEGGKPYKTGDRVAFDLDTGGRPVLGTGEHTGYLQLNIPAAESGAKKRRVAAVLEKTDIRIEEWEPGDQSALDSIRGSVRPAVSAAEDAKENAKRSGTSWPRNRALEDLLIRVNYVEENGGIIPVYYFEAARDGKKLYYLSGATTGTMHQSQKWAKIMEEHSPCDSFDRLCPACALFGTVEGLGAESHLRVTDARAETSVEPVARSLQIFGGPRPSSVEFYLRQPETAEKKAYWNHSNFGVREIAAPRQGEVQWHREATPGRGSRGRADQVMEAVPAGTSFAFRVYFDCVNREQFNDLVWLISLGENRDDGKHQYRLGYARPLGYGSVKMVVKDCVTRTLCEDFTMSTQHIDIPVYPTCGFDIGSKTIQSTV